MHAATYFVIDFKSQYFKVAPHNVRIEILYDVRPAEAGGLYHLNAHLSIYGGGMFRSTRQIASTITHEISHAVVHGMIDKPRAIPPLDEGFADYMALIFSQSKYGQSEQLFSRIRREWWSVSPWHSNFAEVYENYARRMHHAAHRRLTRVDYTTVGVGFVWLYTDTSCPDHIAPINTYVTAASFVAWLIETHGTEKFSQVFFDVDNFINVYDRDIWDMVDEWRSFLKDTF
ncbi:MAG: hypothetical protein FWE21_09530 [Defluviitaleaceae bacterium]|nr:hypothetical protein [Defluviitaleaceae bacterium]